MLIVIDFAACLRLTIATREIPFQCLAGILYHNSYKDGFILLHVFTVLHESNHEMILFLTCTEDSPDDLLTFAQKAGSSVISNYCISYLYTCKLIRYVRCKISSRRTTSAAGSKVLYALQQWKMK